MRFAPRVYVTVTGLAHDEYLSDGVLTDIFRPETARLRIWPNTAAYILRFLNQYLNHQPGKLEKSGDQAMKVEIKESRPLPPTALEIIRMLDRDGARSTRRLLGNFRNDLDEEAVIGAARILIQARRLDDAALLSRWAERLFLGNPLICQLQGEVFDARGEATKAFEAYDKAIAMMDAIKEASPEQKALFRALVEKTKRGL